MRLGLEQLERPAEETARYLALAHLSAAQTALGGVDAPDRAEALHDFRVALRRLRSLERAYRPWLEGSLPRRLRRRLRDLVRSTGGGRDAEVHLAWLDRISNRLGLREVAGLERLRERLRADVEGSYRSISERAIPEFSRIREDLSGRLESYELTVKVDRPSAPPSFLAVSGPIIDRYAGRLAERLDRVRGPTDASGAHEARIAGKRLRYLLEPLGAAHGTVEERVKELKRLQDLLGELHDLHVLAPIMADVLEAGAAERARRLHEATLAPGKADGEAEESTVDVAPGILCITRILREERERLYDTFCSAWLEGAAEPFFQALRALARRCAASRGGDLEIERTYVLAGLPERLKDAEPLRLDLGWLPGKRIRERIRRVRSAAGERYYRTLEIGSASGGAGVEERMGRALWRKLWPLTEGRRIRKRRYEVTDEKRRWQVDEFLDFGLVLAEVELESEGEEVTLPSWLAPWVVEDVTGQSSYENVGLARRGPPRRRTSGREENA